MRIDVSENGEIILKEVYNGVGLESNSKEVFRICMRDSGFEFTYEGENYTAQNGEVKKLGLSEPNAGTLPIDSVSNRRELLLDFAEYSENDKTSTAIDECVDNYLDSIK